MSNIKCLPLAQSPIVGLPYLAYPLTIILNYEECKPWFYSNYIQLDWNPGRTDIAFHSYYYDDVPWLEMQLIKRDILKSNSIEIIDFIINAINGGYYIQSYYDEFYVPNMQAYRKKHFGHDFLIYGYDLENKELHIICYTDTRNFTETKISFKQFEEAFYSIENLNNEDQWVPPEWRQYIRLLKKDDEYRYTFSLNNIVNLLKDYLNSSNTVIMSSKYKFFLSDGFIYGMDIYKALMEFYRLLIENKSINNIKYLHILYEHKKCMTERFDYLVRNSYIAEDTNIRSSFENIEKKMLNLRNLHIKYEINQDPKILLKIIDELSAMESFEKNTINKFIEILQSSVG